MKKFCLICGSCLCFFMLGAYTVGLMYNIKEIETWRILLISFLGISFLIEYTKEVKRDVIKNQDEI